MSPDPSPKRRDSDGYDALFLLLVPVFVAFLALVVFVADH